MTTTRSAGTIPVPVLLEAYASGYFPMAHEDGELYWHRPDPRAVFEMERVQPDRTTSRIMRSGRYHIAINTAFSEVIAGCADREGTWIDERIMASFAELHRMGHAHSLEVWQGSALVGGIYGVAMGAAFFGESMFGRSGAGKVAFNALVAHLRARGYLLFDTQYINPFTASLGASEIPRVAFETMLASAIQHPVRFQ